MSFSENNSTVYQSEIEAKAGLLHLPCIFLLTDRTNLISRGKSIHTTAAITLLKLASESSQNPLSLISALHTLDRQIPAFYSLRGNELIGELKTIQRFGDFPQKVSVQLKELLKPFS